MSDALPDEFPKSEKQSILASIARDATERGEVRLRAVELHAKLSGDYERDDEDMVTRLEATLRRFQRPEDGDKPTETVLPPAEVMSRLSRMAQTAPTDEMEFKALNKMADIYTLNKRDHGEGTRAQKFEDMANMTDNDLDAALNRGTIGK